MLTTVGGGEDEQLIATFHDGKTVSVPKNKAMWIPRDLYERAVFEIGLPKNVRQEFATQDFYPYYSSFGYPTSGSLAYPAQFDQFVPQGYVGTRCRTSGWGSSSCRGYPWMARSQSASAIRGRPQAAEGGMMGRDELIPGTELTKAQLNSKVMAQIMQSKLEDRHSGSDDGRLLKKRSANDTGVLKKSVSFADLKDAECGYLSDSGHGSQLDLSLSDVDDDFRRQGETAELVESTRDARLGSRSSAWRAPRRPRTSSPQRRTWRYWNNDPSPSLFEPKHYGPYREGPYRDCVNSVSVLLRDAKKNDYNMGNFRCVREICDIQFSWF